MRARLEQMIAEWRQNRRLRLGALVVLVVLGLHFVFGLADGRDATMAQYARDADLLARLQEAGRESAWPERAVEAEAALAAVEATLPEVASAGLAQAELQAWLAGQAASAGLAEARVRAETTLDVPGHPALWQVVARLDAQVPPGRMSMLLHSLSGGLPWIQVERVDISQGRQTQVSLVVRAYYRKAAGVDADAPAQGDPA
ncbi:hypothetical protein N788_11095 [Arenimonas donghaensis DSM 18148 = HO3-R19]|uniref:Type II secretion system protein M n=2 Tax=Arenimonas TaxID=490567 RepID=A0A087MJL1_9GAMM|nr:hypothetical protein N788_11095 [Arenimonas donghaensis DSM 18148 = HO3-R19]